MKTLVAFPLLVLSLAALFSPALYERIYLKKTTYMTHVVTVRSNDAWISASDDDRIVSVSVPIQNAGLPIAAAKKLVVGTRVRAIHEEVRERFSGKLVERRIRIAPLQEPGDPGLFAFP